MTEVSRVSSIDILKHKQGVETSVNTSQQTSVFGNPAAGVSSNEVTDIEQLQQENAEPEKIQVLRQNFKDFHLNLSSDEYKNMKPKEKRKFIINEFGKFLYGDEEKWVLLSDKEKASFLNAKINDYIREYEPEKYEKINVLNNHDLEAMQQILTTSFEVALSTANGETDLETILKNYHSKSPKERLIAEYNYVKQLHANGEELTDAQNEILMRGEFHEGLQQYIKDNNIENDNKDEVKFNYLQSRIDENGMEELSEYEKAEYGALKLVKDKFGGFVDDGKNTGLVSLDSFINCNSEYEPVRHKDGRINFESDTTKHEYEDYIKSHLKNYSSLEDKIKWFVRTFGNLDQQGTQNLFKILNDPHCKIKNKNELLKALAESSASTSQSMTAVSLEDKNTTDETRVALGEANNTYIERFAENHDGLLADLMVNTNIALIRSSESENVQAELTVDMAETNYTVAVQSTAKLADELGINEQVDENLANSKKASGETQSLYAQTSVEIQKDDEAKIIRTKELNEYANAHFTKGTVEALTSYTTDEARNKADKIITDTVENKLDEDGRKLVTQARMDVMSDFSADLQKQMYERTMQSKHDDVLQTGANNIYKLDDSVKDYAVNLTKSLGKENVTNSIRTEAPQVSTKSVDSVNLQQTQAVQSMPISNKADATKMDATTKSLVNEITQASTDNTKAKEFVEKFSKAKIDEQVSMIDSLPAVYKKTAITMVCRFNSLLLGQFILQGRGPELLSMGLPLDVQNKIIDLMFKSGDSKTLNEACAFVKKHPKSYPVYYAMAMKRENGENKHIEPPKFSIKG